MSVTIRQMLEAGVHFGHQTRFWNPKMAPFIFGHRNKIHIINLEKTLVQYQAATKYVRQLAANRGTILFVGTKRQSREIIAEEAARAGMPYVDERWLGGMMTNFKTVKGSIKRLKDMEQAAEEGALERMTKKEGLMFAREREKLTRSLGGIKDLGGSAGRDVHRRRRLPQDRRHRSAQARRADRRPWSTPTTRRTAIDYVIPGNDDSGRAVAPVCPRNRRRHPGRPQRRAAGRGQGRAKKMSLSRSSPKRPDPAPAGRRCRRSGGTPGLPAQQFAACS